MHGMRHKHNAVKAKVPLEAIKGEKTIVQIAGEYGIHPN
jgi:transposase-like protein